MKLIENIKSSNQERKLKELNEKANTFFQVQEHKGELWLSFNGCPVMPTSFLKSEPLTALKEIRELFVKERMERDNLIK